MGFLHRAATTRSSTPSSSKSATNCGGPASSEQLSPNCLWMSSSVTGGDGALACAGGGGGSFLFGRAARTGETRFEVAASAKNRNIKTANTKAGRADLLYVMLLL